MRKSKLSMLVIVGLCALGVSSFATSSGEASRQAEDVADRAQDQAATRRDDFPLRRTARIERAGLGFDARKLKEDGLNLYGDAFDRMRRNMDLMDAYFDKHFKKGQGQFRVPEQKRQALEADWAKKRVYLDQRLKDERRSIAFAVSRKADLMIGQPLAFLAPGAVRRGPAVKEGQPASKLKAVATASRQDDDPAPDAGPYDDLSEDEVKNSSIVDKLEKIPPVNLDRFEAWEERKRGEAASLAAKGDRGPLESVNLNEKTRELDARNRKELPDRDKADPKTSPKDEPVSVVEPAKGADGNPDFPKGKIGGEPVGADKNPARPREERPVADRPNSDRPNADRPDDKYSILDLDSGVIPEVQTPAPPNPALTNSMINAPMEPKDDDRMSLDDMYRVVFGNDVMRNWSFPEMTDDAPMENP